jgi:hypothetical protein
MVDQCGMTVPLVDPDQGDPATTAAVPLFYVVRSNNIAGWIIRWVTRSKWNHAGIITLDGNRIAAHPGGAGYEEPSKNEHIVYACISVDDHIAISNQAHALIDAKYGWWDIVSIGLLQWGIRPGFVRRRVQNAQPICSQLVDLCISVRWQLFDDGRLPMDVTPGDLVDLGALNVGIQRAVQ